jgi:hypothetical protein
MKKQSQFKLSSLSRGKLIAIMAICLMTVVMVSIYQANYAKSIRPNLTNNSDVVFQEEN